MGRNIKYIIVLIMIFFLVSCEDFEAERDYNIKKIEIETKKLELDYLQELWRVRNDIEFKEKMRVIDSLVNEINSK